MLRFDEETLGQLKAKFEQSEPIFADFFASFPDAVSSDDEWDVFASAFSVLAQFDQASTALPGCEFVVGANRYWKNAEGALVPVESIRPADLLEDEVVRKIIGFAAPLSNQIARFWQHTHADISGFIDLVLQQYKTSRGGKKGNITLSSFDDMFKVELRVAKLIEFKSDLIAAKALTDECLANWSEASGAEIRTIVRSAFNVDKDGKVNQQALLSLLRHDFDDPRWKLAMDAIRDAIRVRATKEYLRFWQRPAPGRDFEAITIDLAQA